MTTTVENLVVSMKATRIPRIDYRVVREGRQWYLERSTAQGPWTPLPSELVDGIMRSKEWPLAHWLLAKHHIDRDDIVSYSDKGYDMRFILGE